jgi:ATP-dependent Clp protease protease subunit
MNTDKDIKAGDAAPSTAATTTTTTTTTTTAAAADTPAPTAATAKKPLTIDEQLKVAQIEEIKLRTKKTRSLQSTEALESAARLRSLLAQAESAELDLARKRRETSRETSGAEEHLTYTIWDGVTSDSMKACVVDLSRWSRRFPGQAMTLILNSPGGAVTHGLALYDFILKLRADGHHVTVIVLGQAASMGGILLQAGDKRIIGTSSRVLIHEVSAGTSGNVQKMDDDVENFKANWDKLAHILAYRSHLTVAQVKRKAYRFDWWLTAKEAVADGFADEILAAPVEVEGVKHDAKPKATKAKALAKAKGRTRKPAAK